MGLEARPHRKLEHLPSVQARAAGGVRLVGAALHGDRTIDVKSAFSIGIDPFQRADALRAVLGLIDVDALGPEPVVPVHHQGYGRRGLEVVLDGLGVQAPELVLAVGADDIRVHLIVPGLRAPRRRKSGRSHLGPGLRVCRLVDDVVEEDVGVRIDIRGQPALLVGDGPKAGGRGDGDRAGIHAAGGHVSRDVQGRAAVHRVVDLCSGRLRGDRDRERLVVEAAVVAELRIGDDPLVGDDVEGPRRRDDHVAPRISAGGEPSIRDVAPLVLEGHGIEQRGSVLVEQDDSVVVGIQLERRVQARSLRVVVEPDNEIALGRNPRQVRRHSRRSSTSWGPPDRPSGTCRPTSTTASPALYSSTQSSNWPCGSGKKLLLAAMNSLMSTGPPAAFAAYPVPEDARQQESEYSRRSHMFSTSLLRLR